MRFFTTVWALAIKETLQIFRDPSSILMAVVIPLVLLFFFGYAISLDLRGIRVGVALEDGSEMARSLAAAIEGSTYMDVTVSTSRRDLTPLLTGGRLDAVVVIPPSFTRTMERGGAHPIEILVRGTEASTSKVALAYVRGAWLGWLASKGRMPPGPSVEPRIWFNEEMETTLALIPGSIAVIITLIGTMLTSLVMAREWERGTMEALLAMPISRLQLIVGKLLPYYLLAMVAMTVVTAVAVGVMGLPLRGTVTALAAVTTSFLIYSLGLGLFISTAARNQFLATMAALIVGFLPALILSGLIFEPDSMPWPIRYMTYVFAPRYFVTALRTVFLVGDVWELLVPNMAVMAAIGIALMAATVKKTRMDLE